MFRRAVVSWLGLFFVAGLLAAQPKPSSDLLLPYFEVDLDDGVEDGEATTVFAVINALARQVDVNVTVYTNWGSQALSFPVKLKAGEILSADLDRWLNEGKLPGRTMDAAELARVRARLSGQPDGGLYYSTEVVPGRATGYLVLRTLGGKAKAKGGKAGRPDALRGEAFLVDPAQGPARGHDLIDVDPATRTAVCLRHNVRHLAGTGLGQARMVLWRDLAGQILPTPVPADRRRHVDVAVYSAGGTLVRNHRLQVLPAEQVSLAELGLTEPGGRLEVTTEDPSVAAVHASENGAALESTCAQAGGPPREPAIKIVTLANGEDANAPPGPKVPVGSTVTFQYKVSNTGAGALNQIKVRDSQGIEVRCPRNKLAAGEAMICKGTGPAEVCLRQNVGTVVATASVKGKKKVTVSAQDPSHYTGDDGAAVRITVSTNGQDANDPEGPRLQSGSRVEWSYLVENTGTIRLYEVKVEDDHNVAIDCPRVSLAPGEPMTCAASGIVAPGPYRNLGTVTASATCGLVSDDDVSHYFGESETRLQLRAFTNGFDSDFPPGPTIPVGSPVTWEYVVTNTGKLDLHALAVADDKGTAVTCPDASLEPGKSMTCVARGVAQACAQSRFATATGRTSEGQPVSASDSTHYTGEGQAAIQVELSVNGSDADLPPGPSIVIGNPVQWSYVVSNLGKVALSGVQVTDDKSATVTCPKSDLQPGESMTCSAAGMALSGDFRNLATAAGKTPCGSSVSDDDPSHYRGFGDPGIRIQTRTNGEDANVPTGPKVPIGSTVNWDYLVSNTGQLTLSDLLVKDSRGVGVTCPKTSLPAGQSMTCVAQGVARACQYDNLGTVTGRTPSGTTVSAVDPSYYFGQPNALVQVETAVNGAEADSAPGPTIRVGSDVTWTYTIANLGDVELSGIQVTDDQGAVVTCPKALLPGGETMVCTAKGKAAEGQQRNAGTVSAAPPCGPRVTAQDAANYFGGGEGALTLRKLTNGSDANEPPGPQIPVGDPVVWTYVVKNTGSVSLSGVGVTDNRGVTVICPKSTLAPDEEITCTGVGTAQACQYSNLGIATGTTSTGQQVTAVDPSYYFGESPAALSFEAELNGQDAGTSPGPVLPVGSPVSWTYAVTNRGDAQLVNVRVIDQSGGLVSCPKAVLQPGELMTCTSSGVVVEGAVSNKATVRADSPCGGQISAEDTTWYTGGGGSGIDIRKRINGQDAEQAPGPSIPVGTSILWTYVVTNSGQVTLSQVLVTDDDPAVVPVCPKDVLQPGESMTCTGRSLARACQYSNVGKATGLSATGSLAAASDVSYYHGEGQAGIRILTATNGFQADTAPGPTIPVGSPVTWTYIVINTGDVELADVLVSDDQGAPVVCTRASLAPGESMTCTASGTAAAGQYANVGSVTAAPPCGSPVSAEDSSHYFGGGDVGLSLQKRVNNQDVSQPPGPGIPAGQPVTWTYVVTNTGQVALANVSVADDRGVTVSCPANTLAAGASMTCSGSGAAQACQYQNLGLASGKAASGQEATAVDPSYYFGTIQPGIQIETRINSQDADTSPGPEIPVNSPLTWAYVVTNTGNSILSNVLVGDDRLGPVSCPKTTLQPGERMTCYTFGTAVAGQYGTAGSVTADPPCGNPVADDDGTHYFGGGVSGLQLQKLLNGQDAPWPGPEVPAGQQVSWSYVVTNTGQGPLSAVGVADDDPGVIVSCPKTTLQPGEAMTCASNKRTARECQYVNVATATATGSGGSVRAFDSSAYQGQFTAAVQIETSVSASPAGAGSDADTAPGLFVAPGSILYWTYRITNPSTVRLTNVQVRDDQGAAVDCGGISEIAAGQFIVCRASGKAPSGQFRNTGIVSASPPCGELVGAEDPSYSFGIDARIDIQTFTNGEDGPTVLPGTPIAWTYVVQNPGNVPVSGIGVSDSKGVAVSCPKTVLQPAESMTCTAQGTAQMCRYDNEGRAAGVADGGFPVSDADPSFYLVTSVSAIDIEMSVDGQDADTVPGTPLLLGAPVTFTYTVKNTGQAELTNVTVADDNGTQPDVTLTCNPPANSLAVGATMTCTAQAATIPGLYSATARVTANDSCGTIQDVDQSHYNTPVFEFRRTSTYYSGPILSVTDTVFGVGEYWEFWRPNPDSGYFSLGDYYRAYSWPVGSVPALDSVVTVRVKEYDNPARPALRAPSDYFLVAVVSLNGTGGGEFVWKPVGPAGYVCTGHVFDRGSAAGPFGATGLDRYRCLRQDLAVQVDIGPRVTPDSLDQDMTVFRIPQVNALHVVSPKAGAPGEKAWIPYGPLP